jgi:hypothetical protein
VHFKGKDNIVFHCIIFPAMLHLRGDGYVVPTDVPANEFLNLEGQKISTSRNWAVWLNEYLVDLPNKQDELRYVLTSIAPETKDSEFTWKDYQTRVNSELVGIYGNFANRVLVLMNKFYNGAIPAKNHNFDTAELCKTYIAPIAKLIADYKFRDAQFGLMELARFGNKYLAEQEPWKLIKTDEAAAASVLQFASTTKTDTFSTSATSFTDVTGLSVSITPSLSTSKIFIILSCNLAGDSSAGGAAYQLVRGSTAICIGDTAGSRPRSSGGMAYISDPNSSTTISGSFLDSPATTSSTTYKVQIYGNGSTYVNRTQNDTNGTQIYNARSASTITVMEIAA